MEGYLSACPKCRVSIFVLPHELNCRIFRCGVFKATGLPINPHLSQAECQRLVASHQIYGCGAAFTFDGTAARECPYI